MYNPRAREKFSTQVSNQIYEKVVLFTLTIISIFYSDYYQYMYFPIYSLQGYINESRTMSVITGYLKKDILYEYVRNLCTESCQFKSSRSNVERRLC